MEEKNEADRRKSTNISLINPVRHKSQENVNDSVISQISALNNPRPRFMSDLQPKSLYNHKIEENRIRKEKQSKLTLISKQNNRSSFYSQNHSKIDFNLKNFTNSIEEKNLNKSRKNSDSLFNESYSNNKNNLNNLSDKRDILVRKDYSKSFGNYASLVENTENNNFSSFYKKTKNLPQISITQLPRIETYRTPDRDLKQNIFGKKRQVSLWNSESALPEEEQKTIRKTFDENFKTKKVKNFIKVMRMKDLKDLESCLDIKYQKGIIEL